MFGYAHYSAAPATSLIIMSADTRYVVLTLNSVHCWMRNVQIHATSSVEHPMRQLPIVNPHSKYDSYSSCCVVITVKAVMSKCLSTRGDILCGFCMIPYTLHRQTSHFLCIQWNLLWQLIVTHYGTIRLCEVQCKAKKNCNFSEWAWLSWTGLTLQAWISVFHLFLYKATLAKTLSHLEVKRKLPMISDWFGGMGFEKYPYKINYAYSFNETITRKHFIEPRELPAKSFLHPCEIKLEVPKIFQHDGAPAHYCCIYANMSG